MPIDTHAHVWGPPTADRPWIYPESVGFLEETSLDIVYTAEKLLSDLESAGVDEAVLVGFPLSEWTDNTYLVSAVREYDTLTGIALVDVFDDGAANHLADLMAVEGILGFRLGAHMPYDRMWRMGNSDPNADWLPDAIQKRSVWRTAAETDALVQLYVHYEQLDQVHELVNSYSNLRYVVDHNAELTSDVSQSHSAFDDLAALATNENVGIKLSHVPHRSNEGFPYRDMHEHVRWLLERFGRERCFWGSDYQFGSAQFDYLEALHWLDHIHELSTADKTWLRERSFARFVPE